MKTVLTLALLCASLGGCAFVPVGQRFASLQARAAGG